MTKMTEIQPSYTVREASYILNLSQVWIRQCIREGRIHAYRPTGSMSNYRIPAEELDRLLGRAS